MCKSRKNKAYFCLFCSRWPEEVYPKYASGSGHIMTRNALFVLEGQMQLNPLISIDDAFIGICMTKGSKG